MSVDALPNATYIIAVRRTYRRRLNSLDSALWDARGYLRSRLAFLRDGETTFLPNAPTTAWAHKWAADELILRFVQAAVPKRDPRSVESGRVALAEFLDKNPSDYVTWERLVERYWIRIVWGRWYVPFDLRPPAEEQDAAGRQILLALKHLRDLYLERWQFVVPHAEQLVNEHRSAHSATPELTTLLAQGLLEKEGSEVCIAANSKLLKGASDWLAARLWDRSEAGPEGAARLTWWKQRVFGLGLGWYNFGNLLGVDAREWFLELSWMQILAESDLKGWGRERERTAARIAAANGIGDVERGLSIVPELGPEKDVFARLRWLDRYGGVHYPQTQGEIAALIGIQLRWRSLFRGRHHWTEWVAELIEAAQSRPLLLHKTESAVRRDPVIAADLLLVPGASSLGLAALATDTIVTPNTWDVAARSQENRITDRRVWRDIAECAAWAIHGLDREHRGASVAIVLEHFCALARSTRHADATRHDVYDQRYRLLREAVTRWPAQHADNALTLDGVGESVVSLLRKRIQHSPQPADTPSFALLLWLAARGADDHSPWRTAASVAVVKSYREAFTRTDTWRHDLDIEPASWRRLARWLVVHNAATWAELIKPPEFEKAARQLGRLDVSEQYSTAHSLVHQIRSHLLLLLCLINGWSEIGGKDPVPDDLQAILCQLLDRWLDSDESIQRPSIVGAQVDIEHFFERRRESLLVPLAKAMAQLSHDRRELVRDRIVSAMTEVRQLATLCGAFDDPPDIEAARTQLQKLPVLTGAEDPRNIQHVQRSIDALIQAKAVDRAEVWLERWAERVRNRRIQGWVAWEVGARQRIRLARERYRDAADARLPDWAERDFDAEQTNDFYRGVAMLHTEPPRCNAAIALYQGLLAKGPKLPSYAVNLFAARTKERLVTVQRKKKLDHFDQLEITRKLTIDKTRVS